MHAFKSVIFTCLLDVISTRRRRSHVRINHLITEVHNCQLVVEITCNVTISTIRTSETPSVSLLQETKKQLKTIEATWREFCSFWVVRQIKWWNDIVIRIVEPQRNFNDCDLAEVVRWLVLTSQLPDPGPVVKSKPVALSRCQPNQSAESRTASKVRTSIWLLLITRNVVLFMTLPR